MKAQRRWLNYKPAEPMSRLHHLTRLDCRPVVPSYGSQQGGAQGVCPAKRRNDVRSGFSRCAAAAISIGLLTGVAAATPEAGETGKLSKGKAIRG